jgi:Leucine-rich repeat (LRR) protein
MSGPNFSCRQVPESVLKVAALQRLYIGGNFIRALPDNISALKSLRELVAPDNYIVELPHSLVSLTALERLTLSNNRIRIVPSNYGHITSLTSLELIGNPLESPPMSLYAAGAQMPRTCDSIQLLCCRYTSAAVNSLNVVLNYLLRVEEAGTSNRLDFSRIYLDANAMVCCCGHLYPSTRYCNFCLPEVLLIAHLTCL